MNGHMKWERSRIELNIYEVGIPLPAFPASRYLEQQTVVRRQITTDLCRIVPQWHKPKHRNTIGGRSQLDGTCLLPMQDAENPEVIARYYFNKFNILKYKFLFCAQHAF